MDLQGRTALHDAGKRFCFLITSMKSRSNQFADGPNSSLLIFVTAVGKNVLRSRDICPQ